MKVKICGIRSERDIEVALGAGASALGFLVGLTHLSEDKLEPRAAAQLIKSLPPFVSSVLVTHLTDAQQVRDLQSALGASTIQIHSPMATEELARLRGALPSTKLIKAVHVTDGSTPVSVSEAVREVEPYVDAVLLDSRTANRLGGTGRTHDWRVSAAVVRSSLRPVILAGGLTPDNARAAATTVRPYALDVNSGVEDDSGDKSVDRCTAFVDAVHDLGRDFVLA